MKRFSIKRAAAAVMTLAITAAFAGSVASFAEETEEPLFTFNVIGDFQLGYTGSYADSNYIKCLNAIKKISPETSFIISVGDNTQHSADSEYSYLIETKEQMLPDVPMYIAIGNHDRGYTEGYNENNGVFETFSKKFIDAANQLADINTSKVYYSFVQNGCSFIVLGPESLSRNDNCNDVYYSEEEYNWFVAEMEKASKSGNPIYVVIHEPFYNTVSGTLPGQNWQGNPNGDIYENNYYLKLKDVMDQYPNAVVFSGHTHWEFSSKQPVSGGDGTTTYVNCSAVGYTWNDNNAGYFVNGKYSGSEGWFVYVYADKIVLKGYDYLNDQYIITKTINLSTDVSAEVETEETSTTASSTADTASTKSGCGSAVTLAAPAVIGASAVLLTKKKKKEEN